MPQLFPFQERGVEFLRSRDRALLADEMGLGKSAQVISALDNQPVIICCPKVAKGVWQNEFLLWRPDYIYNGLEGRRSFRFPDCGESVAITYDSLPIEQCERPAPGTILIGDEAHAIKGWNSKRSCAFRALSYLTLLRKGKVWLLTATPMPNEPGELWNILEAARMGKEAYGSHSGFVAAFNGRNVNGKYMWGKPTEAAHRGFQKVSLRRKRNEVLEELPPKIWSDYLVPLDTETLAMCEELMSEMEYLGISWEDLIELASGAQHNSKFNMAMFSTVRKALATVKIPSMLELLEEYEENTEPLLVFSAHRNPIEVLRRRKGWGVIMGDTSTTERTELARAFQAGELLGLGATIKTAGVALTLTRAAHELFVDREPVPALNIQAEARSAGRIGQTRGVNIRTLVCNHPVDIRVHEILMRKQKLIDEVLR